MFFIALPLVFLGTALQFRIGGHHRFAPHLHDDGLDQPRR
jgi:hypothetical protein